MILKRQKKAMDLAQQDKKKKEKPKKEESKKEVLERFVRANKSEGGFGLGLSIVVDIVKYYNFDIELQSELRKGTKVSILWKK